MWFIPFQVPVYRKDVGRKSIILSYSIFIASLIVIVVLATLLIVSNLSSVSTRNDVITADGSSAKITFKCGTSINCTLEGVYANDRCDKYRFAPITIHTDETIEVEVCISHAFMDGVQIKILTPLAAKFATNAYFKVFDDGESEFVPLPWYGAYYYYYMIEVTYQDVVDKIHHASTKGWRYLFDQNHYSLEPVTCPSLGIGDDRCNIYIVKLSMINRVLTDHTQSTLQLVSGVIGLMFILSFAENAVIAYKRWKSRDEPDLDFCQNSGCGNYLPPMELEKGIVPE